MIAPPFFRPFAMIPELGHVALILAWLLAMGQAGFALAAARRQRASWHAAAQGAAVAQALFVWLGFAALVWAFVVHDFSVMNVAEHSARTLPRVYRITAAWGSHEGSMLLWACLMATWTLALLAFGRRLDEGLFARVLGVMGLVSGGLLAYLLLTSNPFLRLHPPPPDGADLNPLLQDTGMIWHPPLLYLGYAGFAVVFAFAIAALLMGRLDAAWARALRPWALCAWSFLTLAITVGAWWAYYELGWGGWWFWDPSENASLMPWLAATALVHALVACARREALRVWSVFLALGVFALALLGTFLVRSGVLSSVHAFALDPTRGLFILLFLAIGIGAALILFARRARSLRAVEHYRPVSREAALLAGNLLLIVALLTVMLGTLYPLVLDALGLGKISVGPPYFNAVFVPVMVPALLLMGVTPLLGWRQSALITSLRLLRWPATAALLAAGVLPFAFGEWRWQAALGLGLAVWLLLATLAYLRERRRQLGRLPLSAWGMALAHMGLAVGLIGMGLVSAYQSERIVALSPGQSARLGAYEFVFAEVESVAGPNYAAMRGAIEVVKSGRSLVQLHPEKRVYAGAQTKMTEVAIDYGLLGDIYVALGEPLGHETWSVQLYLKPFVGWLWAGALLMAFGGGVAALGVSQRRMEP